MKNEKLSLFGKVLKTVLVVTGILCLLFLLGLTGACEQGGSISAYILRASGTMLVLVFDAWVYHKVFM